MNHLQGTHHGKATEMMKSLPPGIGSPSGHYWCSMCKKMFVLDEPVCPYMPKMCLNTPVAIETLPPGSAAFYERAGLFYPKLVQHVLAAAVRETGDLAALGAAWAEDFLADLAEWRVPQESNPLETLKAFLVFTAGFDVATRSTDSGWTFYLMDADALWGDDMPAKKRSKTALLAGARRVAQLVGLTGEPLDLHFTSMVPGPMGRYYCAGCNMFFEFGRPQSEVTCPFMPQKCIFRPKPIGEVVDLPDGEASRGRQFSLAVLQKIFAVSPRLYRRQLLSALAGGLDRLAAREVLLADLRAWGFEVSDASGLTALWRELGLE